MELVHTILLYMEFENILLSIRVFDDIGVSAEGPDPGQLRFLRLGNLKNV